VQCKFCCNDRRSQPTFSSDSDWEFDHQERPSQGAQPVLGGATIVTVSEIMIRSHTAFAMAHGLVGRPSRVTVEGIRIPEEVYHESLAGVCLVGQGRIEIVSFIKLEASVLRRTRAIAWRNGHRMCHGFRNKYITESNTLAPW
jgi:hypothetical protein